MNNVHAQNSKWMLHKNIVSILQQRNNTICQYIQKKTQIEIDLNNIIKIQIFIFQQRNLISKLRLLYILLSKFYQRDNYNVQKFIIQTIQKQNSLNTYLRLLQQPTDDRLQFIDQKIAGYLYPKLDMVYIIQKFILALKTYARFDILQQAFKYQTRQVKILIQYALQIQQTQQIKYIQYLNGTGYIDKNLILSKILQPKCQHSIRHQAIFMIYDKCINNNLEQDNGMSYNATLLIQYILGISDKAFSLEFDIQSTDQLMQFVRCLTWYNVKSLKELKQKAAICTHLKYGHMRIEFTDTFNIQDIDDQIIYNLFTNNEKRLQRIYSNTRFIITHNTSTKAIQKHKISENNLQQIIQWLQTDDGNVYDVILNNTEYSGQISKQIRYLNYFDYESQQIILCHPQMLLFASIQCVKIINLSQCKNIQSLSSDFNQYNIEDMKLNQLQNFYSNGDQFTDDQNNNTMLQTLFNMSESLRYIHINGGNNVSGGLYLTKNIDNLQQIYIDTAPTIKITLDSKCFFDKLQIAFNQSEKLDIKQLTLNYIGQNHHNMQPFIRYREKANYYHIINYLNKYLSKNNIYYYFLHLKEQKQYSTIYISQLQNYDRKFAKQMINYLLNRVKQVQQKQLLLNIYNNPQRINNYVQIKYYLKHKDNTNSGDISLLLALQLYNYYLKDKKSQYINYKSIQFNMYLLVKYIITSSNEIICNQFNISSQDDVHKYLQNLKIHYTQLQQNIQQEHHFKNKQSITQKYKANSTIQNIINNLFQMNHINMAINFDSNQQLINKNIALNVFQNIQDKLQIINTNFKGIIFYDNAQQNIYVYQLTQQNSRIQHSQKSYQFNLELNQFISSNKNNLFDIVVNNEKYTDIEQCNIRCLNYINKASQSVELTLSYPGSLITAVLIKTTLCNLNRCEYLTNVYSQQNQYQNRNINALTHLKRFYSVNDTYIGKNTMIYDIICNNKLKYVQIIDGQNIIGPMVLKNNIIDLCFFYLCMKTQINGITMFLNDETPSNLCVFHMTIPGRVPGKYTTTQLQISGPLECVAYVRFCLIQ